MTAAVTVAAYPWRRASAWHYFHDAAQYLVSPANADRLNMYVDHPEYQFGPLSALVAAPFLLLPRWIDTNVVIVFGSALGVVTLAAVWDSLHGMHPNLDLRDTAASSRIAAIALLVTWSNIAVRTTHIDDAVALSSTAVAIAAINRQRPWVATTLLALAASAKPWAIVFAPLVLVGPADGRGRRLVALLVGVGAGWAPFLVGNPSTLRAASSFKLRNDPASTLRVLGENAAFTPAWVRPAQMLGGLVLAVVLVRTKRWHGVVMATLALRLLLDPAIHHYYSAGLVLGVLIWELARKPDRVPWLTVAAAVLIEATAGIPHPAAAVGTVRMLTLIGCIAMALWCEPIPAPPATSRTGPAGIVDRGRPMSRRS